MVRLDILFGCEESGKGREAFRKLGHNAWSNDIIDARDNSQYHLKMDVKEAINLHPWHIIILHPECTALSLSGNRWYGKGMPRHGERLTAIAWTYGLWELAKQTAIIGCALENPTGMIWAHIGKPQFIQPSQFGHAESKKTGILTHNLPPLKPTNIIDGPLEQRVWKMPPGPNRKRDRSESYQGIMDAMAQQWGNENVAS